jgi:hypothetical protein
MQLVVLGSDISASNSEARELAEDLLFIVMVFVARHNGLCSAANHKRKQEVFEEAKEDQNIEAYSRQSVTCLSLSNLRRMIKTQEVDQNSAVDLQPMPRHCRKRR